MAKHGTTEPALTTSNSTSLENETIPASPQPATPQPATPQPESPSPGSSPSSSPPVKSSVSDFIDALSLTPADEVAAKKVLKDKLSSIIAKHSVAGNYNILIYYDDRLMLRSDADKIYRAITGFQSQLPILLVMYSGGGDIDAGYLIGKVCREYANPTFVAVVPRQAKSAATLACCAADEIHMGSLSDLGPIDPQFEGFPALGLKYSVEHLAELVGRYPAASEMFADYLHRSLKVIDLGYYERVAESAVQYAERLLDTHVGNLQKASRTIAQHLVYFYKDHGFVIDKDEAASIFGGAVVKANTPEYKLGNEIYDAFRLFARISAMCGYDVYQVGSISSECELIKRQQH